MSLLRNYFGHTKQESPILYLISAEMIQEVAEANLGRRLTDKEIERAHFSMLEDDESQYHLTEFLYRAAEDAMDESDNNWLTIDADFKRRKHLYWLGQYSIGEDKPNEGAIEKIQRQIFSLLAKHYWRCHSENVKRGLAARKNSAKKR